jgi:alpha-ribazole phosphatase/probable phosphoglycerate mutase
MITTRIDLLRHGEVLGGKYYRGITDDPLTDKGCKQMQARVKNIKDWGIIISSPLQRCLDFAEELSQKRHLPLAIEKGFQEINFGDWEAKTATEIEINSPNALTQFYQDPIQYPPPNSESLNDFQQRVLQSWQHTLQVYQGHTILIVTHSGVIRSLFSLLLNIPTRNSFSIKINPASLTRFQCYHGKEDFIELHFLKNQISD